MASVFSSRPTQAISQWELATVMVVPRRRAGRRIARTKGVISKGRVLTIIFGVWAQKLNLADFTRKWCRGSTKSFDLFRLGSSPFFLRSRGDSNPHSSLYQSGPLASGTAPVKTEGEVLQRQSEGRDVRQQGLV